MTVFYEIAAIKTGLSYLYLFVLLISIPVYKLSKITSNKHIIKDGLQSEMVDDTTVEGINQLIVSQSSVLDDQIPPGKQMEVNDRGKWTGQSKMDNPEILATLGTQNTGRRQTKQKQNKQTNKNRNQ